MSGTEKNAPTPCLVTDVGVSRLLPVMSGDFTFATSAHGSVGRLIARWLGLPTAAEGVIAGSLDIATEDGGERWTRTFGTRSWTSTLRSNRTDTVIEHTGPVSLRFTVHLDDRWNTQMTLQSIRIGSMPTPIARWFHIVGVIEPNGRTSVMMRPAGGRCSYTASPTGRDQTVVEIER